MLVSAHLYNNGSRSFHVSHNNPLGASGVGPGCTDKTLLSAIASALHTSAAPITGQLSAAVEKNPGVWLNTAQPLCKAFIVTDEDIRWVITPTCHRLFRVQIVSGLLRTCVI